jgi:phosphoglucomutase
VRFFRTLVAKPVSNSSLVSSSCAVAQVLAANGVETFIQLNDGFTPTPVISRAILVHNRGRSDSLADGGLKYNPPNGGPADTDVTDWIQNRANELLCAGNGGVQRIGFDAALNVSTTHAEDFVTPYVEDLANVIDLEAIRSAGLKIGVDPLGGAAAAYWQPLAERYGIDIAVVNPKIDPTFAFMTLDHDGKIRMDCSSPRARRTSTNFMPKALKAPTISPPFVEQAQEIVSRSLGGK